MSERENDLLATAAAFNTQPFFRSRRAAAVLKHAILSNYVVPFASKTGSASAGNRVVLVDGYAGSGRYDDRRPGSPTLLIQSMRTPALAARNVECFFIEQDAHTYEHLCRVLKEEDPGHEVLWEAWEGSVEQHLGYLLNKASGVPLFVFLDPFGLGLPFDVITDIFTCRPAGQYTPATEALIRIDAQAIFRIRGALHSKKDYPAREAQLESLDRVAGGTWWRDEDEEELSTGEYLEWFMTRLLSYLCKAAKCSGWYTEVRQRDKQVPAYYLVFLTRHRDGMDVFVETLSLAQGRWRRAVFDEALAAEDGNWLLPPDEVFEASEKALADRWIDRLEQNMRDLLASEGAFVVRAQLSQVFAGVLGIAREKHLRAALKRLEHDCTTTSNSKGNLYGKRIVPS